MNFIIKLLVNAVAVYLTTLLLPDSVVFLEGFWAAIIVSLILAILNATLKPILIVLTIPATVFTLGAFLIVIDALVLLCTDWLLDDFDIKGFWWAILFALVLMVLNSILEGFVLKDKDGRKD